MINHSSSISFIIPAFNCAKTLVETVNSIYDNNFKTGDEVIIVDDASTDNTYEIATDLIKKFEGIKLIKHPFNKGTAAAGRNTAMEIATNELFFCIDADNILMPNSIQLLKEFMINEKADTAAFNEIHYFLENDPNKNISHKWFFKNGVISLSDALAGAVWPGPSGNYMLTKQCWLKSGRYHEFVGGAIDSWAFGIKQLINNSKMVTLPNSFYLHRYGYDSTYVRDARKLSVSLQALPILLPILNQINEEDVELIMGKKGRTSWLENKIPIRLKNQENGETGRIEYLNKEIQVKKTNILNKIIKKLGYNG